MNFKSLDELMEEYNKKVYTSTAAEYKRVVSKSVAETIYKPIDVLWKEMMTRIFKSEADNVFMGQKITIEGQSAWVKEIEDKKVISIIFFANEQFISQEYRFKSLKNGHTKLTYTQSVKKTRTTTGLNGQLGSIMYRWNVKKRALDIFRSLQPEDMRKKK